MDGATGEIIPKGLKPSSFLISIGPTEVVP